jgi:hypothetical protein
MNFLIFQYLGFAIWIISLVITLFWIQRSNLENLTKAVWTLIVLIVPIFGSFAFIIVHRLGAGPPTDKSAP